MLVTFELYFPLSKPLSPRPSHTIPFLQEATGNGLPLSSTNGHRGWPAPLQISNNPCTTSTMTHILNFKSQGIGDGGFGFGLWCLFLGRNKAQRVLKQKLNKHYLDLGLALRLLESLGVAETKIICCLLGFHVCSLTGLYAAPGLVQNTSTGKCEVQMSMWKICRLPHFHNFLISFLS